ncbi:MAG: class I SAM-dependent methyltransferase [Candidatus Moranbacteria bacterium]|nr:class I SAM-dependent methyltransferase [Candidatus Moranbacteria bacterium]
MHLSPYWYEKIIRPRFFVVKYIQNVLETTFDFRGKKVLDFGCGTGSNSFIFDQEGYLGMDVDAERVDLARQLHPKYTFQYLKDGRIAAPDMSFDYVVILATIHHVSDEDFSVYVSEFKRVLKPEGVIVCIEPVLDTKTPLNNWFMNFFDDGRYIRFESQYRDLFHGFEVVVHRRFKKNGWYNEVFFSAKPKM